MKKNNWILVIGMFLIVALLGVFLTAKNSEIKTLEILHEESCKNFDELKEEFNEYKELTEGYKKLAMAHQLYSEMIAHEVFPNNVELVINNNIINTSGKTAEEIYNENFKQSEQIFTIILNGEEHELNLTDCYFNTLTISDIANVLKMISFEDYVSQSNNHFSLENKLDYNLDLVRIKMYDFLNTLNWEETSATNASFDFNTYSIIPSKDGKAIDINSTLLNMVRCFEEGNNYCNLNDNLSYKNVPATVTTLDMEEKYGDLIDVYNWYASYSVSDYVIRMSDYMDYVTLNDDNTCSIDTSFMKYAVLGLSKTVDEKGIARTFNSTLDGVISVKGGTYGQVMNNNEEISYLNQMLSDRQIVDNREPIWKVSPKEDGYENTYIEIDLSAQHVWYYEDNVLIMESDCVTGTANTSRETPVGFYFVSEKVKGKYLTGDDYRTWVDRWMRITNQGHGLHDASWRDDDEFGGNTYIKDGSHGCINLPTKFAYELYDAINKGVLVIIHE